MRVKLDILFISLAVLCMAFTMPWEKEAEKNKAPQQAAPQASYASDAADDEFADVDEEAEDEDAEPEDDVAEAETLTNVPTTPGGPNLPSIPEAPQLEGVRSAKNPAQDIMSTQRQLREILQINDSLRNRYGSQAREIQKISEQARIHQRILNDIEKTKGPGAVTAVEQQKIRVIQEETNKANQFIQNLEENQPQRAGQAPAVETTKP